MNTTTKALLWGAGLLGAGAVTFLVVRRVLAKDGSDQAPPGMPATTGSAPTSNQAPSAVSAGADKPAIIDSTITDTSAPTGSQFAAQPTACAAAKALEGKASEFDSFWPSWLGGGQSADERAAQIITERAADEAYRYCTSEGVRPPAAAEIAFWNAVAKAAGEADEAGVLAAQDAYSAAPAGLGRLGALRSRRLLPLLPAPRLWKTRGWRGN